MNRSNQDYLQDMLSYARDAVEFIQGESLDSLKEDKILARALTFTVGVIGEAASNISREFQDANPHIPWPQIIGMRNRLFHGYGEINYQRLWDTVTTAIPPLIVELEKLMPQEGGERE